MKAASATSGTVVTTRDTRLLSVARHGIGVACGVFGFDGEKTSLLTKDAFLGEWALLRPCADPYPGVILQTYISDEVANLHGKERGTIRVDRYFVPSAPGPLRIQLPPEFTTEDARSVTLADVVGWKTKDQAVVELDDGFFLLEAKPAASAP